MSTIDSLSKELFRDSHVFADVINGHFFHGEQVVRPESLSDMDPTEIVLPDTTGKDKTQEYRRDLLKLRLEKSRQDGWLEGLREGKIKGNILGCISTMHSLYYSQDEILATLKELYSLTAEQAMPYMGSASE